MYKKTTYYVFILFFLCEINFAQTNEIEGIVNDYARVSAISGNTVTLLPGASSMFSANDTVLLMQMTGVSQNGVDFNNAGRYEFNIIDYTDGDNIFLKSVSGAFDAGSEIVQLIRVPSYKNATVVGGGLTCLEWDRSVGTGGVVVLMVDNTLTLNADIDVSGRGFAGATADEFVYTGTQCLITGIYGSPNYPSDPSNNLAGKKGEGAITLSLFNPGFSNANLRGFAPAANGGGGGNGGVGGPGGKQFCDAPGSTVGNSGSQIDYVNSEHIFMGGGGGTGTRSNVGIGSKGGNGGGIVIIVANRLQFTPGAAIKANGESVNTLAFRAGAGGGGAGGSVLLSVNEYDEINMKIEIMGGNGGNVDVERHCGADGPGSDISSGSTRGIGGGGGGGMLFTSKNLSNLNSFLLRNGGEAGKFENMPPQTGLCTDLLIPSNSVQGMYLDDFLLQLNGFLHNYFFTFDMFVCYGDEPVIIASVPKSIGDNNIFRWEKSATGFDNWTNVVGATAADLSQFVFDDDIYLRRVVTSGTIVDYSSPLKVFVYDQVINVIDPLPVEGNVFCGGQTIMFAGNTPTGGGDEEGSHILKWQIFDGVWRDISSTLLPDNDVVSAYQFRRVATSSKGCYSDSNESVEITVQPSIRNNIITANMDELCEGDSVELTGSIPSGGDGITMNYQWQVKNDNGDWENIDYVIADERDYHPRPYLHQGYVENIYQRYTTSGKCEGASNPVTIRIYKKPPPPQINTPHRIGDDALTFKFVTEIEAHHLFFGSGLWSSDNENTTFEPDDETSTTVNNLQLGENTITWTVFNGVCEAQTTLIKIFVKDVWIPTAFSPKSEAHNDCFRIVGGENAITSELKVFDRYNDLVYENKSFIGDGDLYSCDGWWDGRSSSGRELPTGVYYYHIVINGDKIYNGYVLLKND